MKHKTSIILAVMLIIFFNCNPLTAKDFSMPLVCVVAEINTDGSIDIEEERTYKFDGRFSWADYSVPLQNLGSVKHVVVSEAGINYSLSDSEQPGSYNFTTDDKTLYIKWYYSADNQTRTFKVSYTITDAVTVYADVAEFYYKFADKDRPKQIDSMDVRLYLPRPADEKSVKIWAHGPLNGQIRFHQDFIHSWARPLPTNYFWENRILFPTEWVADAVKTNSKNALPRILNEERSFAEKANKLRTEESQAPFKKIENDKKAKNMSIAIISIGILLLYYLYQRFGKGHTVRSIGPYTSEVPDTMPPAVLNYIQYDGSPNAGALMSTIMDLSRRNFLHISDTGEKPHSFWSSNSDRYTLSLNRSYFEDHGEELKSFEKTLLEFLFDDLSKGADVLTFEKISKSRGTFIKWFSEWKKAINQEWGDNRIYEKRSVKGVLYAVLSGLIVIAAGIFLAMISNKYGGITVISGILLTFLSITILTYTRETKETKKTIQAFKKYLSRYHYQQDPALLQSNFEKYLIYGTAVGITPPVLKKMFMAVNTTDASFIPWYTSALVGHTPTDLGNAFTSMINAASTSMSSASGTGGGASAGGGGGAGGASGGAG